MDRRLRLGLITAAALAVVAALLFAGSRLALQRLQAAVAQALGPRGSVASIEVGWHSVRVRGLRIAGDRGARPPWPADDELRADEVELVPDLRSAFAALGSGAAWRVHSVTVRGGQLTLLRGRDGRLQILPGLLGSGPGVPPAGPAASAPAGEALPKISIGEVRLEDTAVDFFDASVRQPPHRLRLEKVRGRLERLELPALERPMPLTLEAVFKGPQRDGTLKIGGELALAARDASLDVRLAGVDLVALQPYLVRLSEGGVRRGQLDLALDARVKANRLQAPGRVTLTGLELAGGSLAGVPRQAVLAAMSRQGRIELRFTLAGRLDDPAFSLNENIATRIGAGLAEALGVSVGGVVEGVGNMIKGLFGR